MWSFCSGAFSVQKVQKEKKMTSHKFLKTFRENVTSSVLLLTTTTAMMMMMIFTEKKKTFNSIT